MKKVWSDLAIYGVKGDSAKLHLGYFKYVSINIFKENSLY